MDLDYALEIKSLSASKFDAVVVNALDADRIAGKLRLTPVEVQFSVRRHGRVNFPKLFESHLEQFGFHCKQ